MKTLILTENNFGFWDIYRRFCYEKENVKIQMNVNDYVKCYLNKFNKMIVFYP